MERHYVTKYVSMTITLCSLPEYSLIFVHLIMFFQGEFHDFDQGKTENGCVGCVFILYTMTSVLSGYQKEDTAYFIDKKVTIRFIACMFVIL